MTTSPQDLYRGAAAICGTNHHTVKAEVLRRLSGADAMTAKQAERAKNRTKSRVRANVEP